MGHRLFPRTVENKGIPTHFVEILEIHIMCKKSVRLFFTFYPEKIPTPFKSLRRSTTRTLVHTGILGATAMPHLVGNSSDIVWILKLLLPKSAVLPAVKSENLIHPSELCFRRHRLFPRTVENKGIPTHFVEILEIHIMCKKSVRLFFTFYPEKIPTPFKSLRRSTTRTLVHTGILGATAMPHVVGNSSDIVWILKLLLPIGVPVQFDPRHH